MNKYYDFEQKIAKCGEEGGFIINEIWCKKSHFWKITHPYNQEHESTTIRTSAQI